MFFFLAKNNFWKACFETLKKIYSSNSNFNYLNIIIKKNFNFVNSSENFSIVK